MDHEDRHGDDEDEDEHDTPLETSYVMCEEDEIGEVILSTFGILIKQ